MDLNHVVVRTSQACCDCKQACNFQMMKFHLCGEMIKLWTNIGSGIGNENGGLETIMVNLETNMTNIKEANWTYLVR